MTAADFLTFKAVAKRFGSQMVLKGLTLDVAQGESLVLIGRSGTGKSVTLKCFLGLLRPEHGDICLEGRSVLNLGPRARTAHMDRVGMLFQGAALFDSLPVWRNVGFRLLNQHQGLKAVRMAVDGLLDQVGLPASVGDLRPADLSGGMQKRVGLARALAGDPDILLFDEPTTGLDPISSAQINALIANLRRARKATALSITHDLASARTIADRIALLHSGQIVWHGPPEALDTDPDPLIRQFAGGQATGPLSG